jgi:hypothetical protein
MRRIAKFYPSETYCKFAKLLRKRKKIRNATYLKYKQQLAIASRVWAYMFKQTQRKMRYTI